MISDWDAKKHAGKKNVLPGSGSQVAICEWLMDHARKDGPYIAQVPMSGPSPGTSVLECSESSKTQRQESHAFPLSFVLKKRISKAIILFYSYGCFAWIFVCVPCGSLVPEGSRRGCEMPDTRRTNSYELLCAFWESNSGPLQDQ